MRHTSKLANCITGSSKALIILSLFAHIFACNAVIAGDVSESAEAEVKKADQLYLEKHYQDALISYQSAWNHYSKSYQITLGPGSGKKFNKIPVSSPKEFGKIIDLNRQMAECQYDMGHYDESLARWNWALEVGETATAHGYATPTGWIYEKIAKIYAHKGLYLKAVPACQEAISRLIKDLGKDHPNVGTANGNLASVYADMGEFEKASSIEKKTIAIYQKALDSKKYNAKSSKTLVGNIAAAYNNMGLFSYNNEDFEKALSFYEKSLELTEKNYGKESSKCIEPLHNIGLAKHQAGKDLEALEYLQRAYKIEQITVGVEHPTTARTLNCMGAAYSVIGDYDRGVEILSKALAIDQKKLGQNHPETAIVLHCLGMAFVRSGKTDDAKATAINYVASVNEGLKPMLTLGEKQRLAWAKKTVLFALPSLALDPDQMDEVVLRWKGMVLDSMLEDLKIAKSFPSETGVISRSIQIQELKAQAAKLSSASDKIDDAQLDAIQQRIDKLEESMGIKFINRVRQSFRVTVKQLVDQLELDDAVIDFISYKIPPANEVKYGFSVICRNKSPKWVALDAEPINDSVLNYRMAIAQGDEELLKNELANLQKSLLLPITSALPQEINKLYLSPDGLLNFLSFATLLLEDGKFLGEKYEICYVGSGRDLLRTPKNLNNNRFVIYANPVFSLELKQVKHAPNVNADQTSTTRAVELKEFSKVQLPQLPGTQLEAMKVSEIGTAMNWNIETFLAEDACKQSVLAMKAPSVLHLATHGFFLGDEGGIGEGNRGMKSVAAAGSPAPASVNHAPTAMKGLSPMRQSGLALTGGQSTLQAWARGEFPDPVNDGILTAEEVAALDLNGTWLVTLSACETGVGEVQSGEGVFGLRRAFMMAGAQNLLMTLWPVSDEVTPMIMSDFYREALTSHEAASSLAIVQRDWLVKLRQEKGLLAAVREAGPFAMVVMANPNKKSEFQRVADNNDNGYSPTGRSEIESLLNTSASIDSDAQKSTASVLAFEKVRKLADSDDSHAQAVLSICYAFGCGVDRNPDKSKQYAIKSAKKQNPLGIYRLAEMRASGEAMEKNETQAEQLRAKALPGLREMRDDPYALYAIADIEQRNAPASHQFLVFLKRSAELGFAPAQVKYAELLEKRQASEEDLAEAARFRQMALQQGYEESDIKSQP